METLYKNNYEALINLVNHAYGNRVEAEDVVQETFLKYLQRGIKEQDNPEGLLRVIALNVAHEHNRKKAYKRGTVLRQVYLEDLPYDWTNLFAEGAEEDFLQEKIDKLYRKVAKLSKKQREAILYRLDGIKFDQIAKITGRSEATAQYNYNMALKNLRRK